MIAQVQSDSDFHHGEQHAQPTVDFDDCIDRQLLVCFEDMVQFLLLVSRQGFQLHLSHSRKVELFQQLLAGCV